MKSPTPADLKSWRKSQGLTQSQAAAEADVSLRTWQNYESGVTSCPASTWELLLIKSGEIKVSPKSKEETER